MDSPPSTPARIYRNHHLDSTRWAAWRPRPDDVVIATPYKCGTTWMQGIVGQLLVPELPNPRKASIWVDACEPLGMVPPDAPNLAAALERQRHRRFLKTHLPFDGLPFHPQVRYIVVSRDPRDVFVSLWNHYRQYSDTYYARVNAPGALYGAPLPRCPTDMRQLWRMWLTRGWFEWETEGFPFWSNLGHVQGWWGQRQRPNVLFVHYAWLLKAPDAQVRRVADHLGVAVTDATVERVVRATQIDAMRALEPEESPLWSGGAATFFYAGTNGRWRAALSPDDLALYDAVASTTLSPDCRAWLEDARWHG